MRSFRIPLKELLGNLTETIHLALCVVSVGVIVSYICVQSVSPAWSTPGWPSFNKYPKNIENAALMASIIGAALTALFFEAFRARLIKIASLAVLVPVAAVIVYKNVDISGMSGSIQLVYIAVLLSSLFYFFKSADAVPAPRKANPLVIIAAGIAGFSVFFMLSVVYWFEYPLDVHHFGEQFTSAADLLAGGRPFITFHWPHGLEDTGIAALFFTLFSRTDVPTMLLSLAFATGLGAITILLLCYGMRLDYYSVLVLAAVAVFNYALGFGYLTSYIFALIALLAFSRAARGYQFFLAGLLTFIAHVYRIELGVYAFVSIIALLLYQAAGALIYDRARLRGTAREAALYLFGTAGAAFFMYLVLGWPGPEWYKTVFYILPRYHADTGGLAFPLFIKSIAHVYSVGQGYPKEWTGITLLITILTMVAIITGYLMRNLRQAGKIDKFPVLLVFFSVFMLKTAFGRSDFSHIHHAFLIPAFLLVLACSRVLIASPLKAPAKILLVGLLFSFFNFESVRLSFADKPLLPHPALFKGSYEYLSGYNEPPPAQCSNSIFSAQNLARPDYQAFDRFICGLKEELSRYGINEKELLVMHSAALIYPALGYGLPTKYYKIGLAITEEMQEEMVSELERNGVKALLRSNVGLTWYDIPDWDRLPVHFKWARERFDMDNPVRTGLGALYLRRDLNQQFDHGP
ncbi:MAG: hypothetical protein HS130_06845 [Deltaproteobacteria bacterium]|nr:hypothetical protein [Deltaproteobacteria bacterium]MCL4872698.1 hypothetical protein [bacterium]